MAFVILYLSMKKVLALLFAFNLFFINPIIFVNNVNDNYVAYADDDAGPGEGGGGDEGGDNGLGGFQDLFEQNADDAGTGGEAFPVNDFGQDPAQAGVLDTIAGYVASAVFTVVNAVATVAYAVGLDSLGNLVTSFGYSFGSNVASEEGLTATAAGAAASAALGGIGGIIAGQIVTGGMQGTLGGDVSGIIGGVVGGTDGPKSAAKINSPGDQTPPYVPNIPKSLGGLNNETEDYCEGNAVNYTLNSNDTYKKFVTQDYKPNWGNNDSFVVKINVRSTDTTKGGQLVIMNYSDSLASRAFARVAVSKAKCNFGSNAQWLGMPIGWQPSAADIARYTYADGTKPTKYLGSNSGSATFSINDSRPGVFNLTTGTWYVTFQYLDNCADRNMANPNRNTTCHKVVEWVGGVQTNNTIDPNDILKTSGGVVLNNVDTFSLKKSTTGYNDLGVAIPKNLSIDDIINPSILNIVKSWVGLPVTDPNGGIKSGTVGNGDPVAVTNYCTGSYPDYVWTGAKVATDVTPLDPTKIYTIKLTINSNVSTQGSPTLPTIMTGEAPSNQQSDKDITISRNPCDFSLSQQRILKDASGGNIFVAINDNRTTPANMVKISSGVWYINIKTTGICGDVYDKNRCGTRVESVNDMNSFKSSSNTSPSIVVVNSNDSTRLGAAAAQAVLNEPFIKNENLNWPTLCSNANIKPIITTNPFQSDYSRQFKAGIEVYPVDISNSSTYEGSFFAISLSSSSNNPVYGFISDGQCAGTSNSVYSFGGGIGGVNANLSNTNYTGSNPGSVKVKPGRWYVTLLWGSGAIPAPTSPNYQTYLSNPTPVYVRLFSRLAADNVSAVAPGANFTPRTISNSSCSINLSNYQQGTVNTSLVYKVFPPNAQGGYYLGSSFNVISADSLAATLPDCPAGTAEGSASGRAGNRSTFQALNAECKEYDNKTRTNTIYKLDYPTSCSTLCASANTNAFIDVRGDCVLNSGSF